MERASPEETQDLLSGPEAPSAVIQTKKAVVGVVVRVADNGLLATCDSWFHTECVTLEFPLEEIHEQEWLCDFCCQ